MVCEAGVHEPPSHAKPPRDLRACSQRLSSGMSGKHHRNDDGARVALRSGRRRTIFCPPLTELLALPSAPAGACCWRTRSERGAVMRLTVPPLGVTISRPNARV